MTLLGCVLLIVVFTLAPQASSASHADSFVLVPWHDALSVPDIIANIVLFVPFGAALMRRRGSLWHVLLVGLGFSLLIEVAQRSALVPGRHASIVDVITNSTGAVIGAGLFSTRKRWLTPEPRVARMMATIAAASLLLVLLAGAWLVTPPSSSTHAASVQRSTLQFTPGFGWFHGVIAHANIDGAEFVQSSTGPLLIEAEPALERRMKLMVSGRDERTGTVPMVFMHAPRDTTPLTMVAQHGTSLLLEQASRGAHAGFNNIRLLVRDLSDSTRNVEVTSTHTSWSMTISARRPPNATSIENAAARSSALLNRSPLLLWALILPLPPISHSLTRALSLLFGALCLFPVGYYVLWAFDRAAAGARTASVLVLTAILTAIGLLPLTLALSPLTLLECLSCTVGAAAGFLAANHQRLHRISHPLPVRRQSTLR